MLTAGVVAPAIADPDGSGGSSGSITPSAGDVRAAKERADDARTDVDGIQERLAAANEALVAASIRAAKAADKDTCVILITGYASTTTAITFRR